MADLQLSLIMGSNERSRPVPNTFARQRRAATSAQTASTSPNGQAPCRNP